MNRVEFIEEHAPRVFHDMQRTGHNATVAAQVARAVDIAGRLFDGIHGSLSEDTDRASITQAERHITVLRSLSYINELQPGSSRWACVELTGKGKKALDPLQPRRFTHNIAHNRRIMDHRAVVFNDGSALVWHESAFIWPIPDYRAIGPIIDRLEKVLVAEQN